MIATTSAVTATPTPRARSNPPLRPLLSSGGRRFTARISAPLVLDPESDRDCERTDLGFVDGLSHLEPAERIAEPDRDAEQARKLRRKAGERRAASGENDLADGEAPRLRLVIGQGRNELADERFDSLMERLESRGSLFRLETVRRVAVDKGKGALEGVDVRLAH